MLTPLEEHEQLARAIGVECLFLKREDQTPTGSFKYRSALRQIEHLIERGIRSGVVSSSGNAAISLAHVMQEEGMRLFAFVSPKMMQGKLEALAQYEPVIVQSSRAMRLANYLSVHHRLPNLRPSVDDHAVIGFISLGEELDEQAQEVGGIQSVFSYSTSGASMLGMTKGYRSDDRPTFFAVEHPDIGYGARKGPRRADVEAVATYVMPSADALAQARELILEHGLAVAEEAVASLAAIIDAKPKGSVVWVVSGRAWEPAGDTVVSTHTAETLEDVNEIYQSYDA